MSTSQAPVRIFAERIVLGRLKTTRGAQNFGWSESSAVECAAKKNTPIEIMRQKCPVVERHLIRAFYVRCFWERASEGLYSLSTARNAPLCKLMGTTFGLCYIVSGCLLVTLVYLIESLDYFWLSARGSLSTRAASRSRQHTAPRIRPDIILFQTKLRCFNQNFDATHSVWRLKVTRKTVDTEACVARNQFMRAGCLSKALCCWLFK